ncbi:hypothetical protein Tco_0264781 [Tanacetum coccineum]
MDGREQCGGGWGRAERRFVAREWRRLVAEDWRTCEIAFKRREMRGRLTGKDGVTACDLESLGRVGYEEMALKRRRAGELRRSLRLRMKFMMDEGDLSSERSREERDEPSQRRLRRAEILLRVNCWDEEKMGERHDDAICEPALCRMRVGGSGRTAWVGCGMIERSQRDDGERGEEMIATSFQRMFEHCVGLILCPIRGRKEMRRVVMTEMVTPRERRTLERSCKVVLGMRLKDLWKRYRVRETVGELKICGDYLTGEIFDEDFETGNEICAGGQWGSELDDVKEMNETERTISEGILELERSERPGDEVVIGGGAVSSSDVLLPEWGRGSEEMVPRRGGVRREMMTIEKWEIVFLKSLRHVERGGSDDDSETSVSLKDEDFEDERYRYVRNDERERMERPDSDWFRIVEETIDFGDLPVYLARLPVIEELGELITWTGEREVGKRVCRMSSTIEGRCYVEELLGEAMKEIWSIEESVMEVEIDGRPVMIEMRDDRVIARRWKRGDPEDDPGDSRRTKIFEGGERYVGELMNLTEVERQRERSDLVEEYRGCRDLRMNSCAPGLMMRREWVDVREGFLKERCAVLIENGLEWVFAIQLCCRYGADLVRVNRGERESVEEGERVSVERERDESFDLFDVRERVDTGTMRSEEEFESVDGGVDRERVEESRILRICDDVSRGGVGMRTGVMRPEYVREGEIYPGKREREVRSERRDWEKGWRTYWRRRSFYDEREREECEMERIIESGCGRVEEERGECGGDGGFVEVRLTREAFLWDSGRYGVRDSLMVSVDSEASMRMIRVFGADLILRREGCARGDTEGVGSRFGDGILFKLPREIGLPERKKRTLGEGGPGVRRNCLRVLSNEDGDDLWIEEGDVRGKNDIGVRVQ